MDSIRLSEYVIVNLSMMIIINYLKGRVCSSILDLFRYSSCLSNSTFTMASSLRILDVVVTDASLALIELVNASINCGKIPPSRLCIESIGNPVTMGKLMYSSHSEFSNMLGFVRCVCFCLKENQ